MTAAVRTGAIRAAKPASVTNARRNRVLGGALVTCMVGGLAATVLVQATNQPAPALAVEAPTVADITAAKPQSYRADVAAAVTASSRDETVALELEPTPTPTPKPTPESSSSSSSSSSENSGGSSSSSSSDSGSSVEAPPVISYDPASLQGQAQAILAAKGYTGDEWGCFDFIIRHESGWNPNAQNPSSGTYGLGQSMSEQNNPDYRNDPIYQINWALDYMVGRYTSPCGAKAFWDRNGWY